jgi:hypothetical protein
MKAVIIYNTQASINFDKTNIKEQFDDYFDDPDIFDMKEFKDPESMFALISKTLNHGNLGVTASNIWEDKNYIYEGYFIDVTEVINHGSENKSKNQKINMNILGSQITSQHVTSNLVIIKNKLSYEIKDNNIRTIKTPCDLTRLDLLDTLESLFIKTGLNVNIDGKIKPFKYIMNPLENEILSDKEYQKHYVIHEYEVYNHVIVIIADTREINGKLNTTASYIANCPVNGPVLIALYKKPEYDENPPYVSITSQKLNDILFIRQRSPASTPGLNKSNHEYVNFEKLIELEISKYKDKSVIPISNIKGELLNIGITKSNETTLSEGEDWRVSETTLSNAVVTINNKDNTQYDNKDRSNDKS